jgi:hypothetical protein
MDSGRRWARAAGAMFIIAGVVLVFAGTPWYWAMATFALAAVCAIPMPPRETANAALALFPVQVGIDLSVAARVSAGDLLMLPVMARWLASRRVPRSSFRAPLLAVLFAFGAAIIVGAVSLGTVSSYILLNKACGLLFLVAMFFTLTACLDGRDAIERAASAFAIGVSAMNALSLLAMPLALAGVSNTFYLQGNMRLYGSAMNPNLFGSLLLVAALMELGRLSDPHAAGRAWRWANVWLLFAGLVLTLSRGTWLAAVCGAGTMMLLQLVQRDRLRTGHFAALTTWAIAPAIALLVLAKAGGAISIAGGEAHAAQLRERFIAECRQNPDAAICKEIKMQLPATAGATVTPTGKLPDLLPWPEGQAAAGTVGTSLTNRRGVDDRIAILTYAARDYLQTPYTMIFGSGLDSFRSRSVPRFGLSVIIHNTFAWFLFEMGPLGLAALLWLWGRAAWNLFAAWRANDWRRDLAAGSLSALCAMAMFCLLNEGFYQRHLWLLFVLADRLFMTAGPIE